MKPNLLELSGWALLGEDLSFSPVDIRIEDGIITAIEDNPGAPQLWICPALFNAHTHLGDMIAMDCSAEGDLASLVAPPDGLKHRLLRAAARSDLVAGIRSGMERMAATGTAGCADFREGGEDGVLALFEAAEGLPISPVVFGRDGGERIAGGLGISSTRDVPGIEQLVRDARSRGKLIAFHAGERDSDDIEAALSYEPDLLIHMTHAGRRHLRSCAEAGIPIAVCPRSNWILGVAGSAALPPVTLMEETGCTVCLGTDNAMFVSPDLFSEMSFASVVYRWSPREILRAAVQGSAVFGRPSFIREHQEARLFVLDPARSSLRFSRDPLATLVKRADSGAIITNVFSSQDQ